MNVHIRNASASDQGFLEEILYWLLYVPASHKPFAREIIRRPELAKYVAHWGKPGDLALIATDSEGGLAIGSVWLRLLTDGQRGYGYVNDKTPELGIAVLPAYRGRGVGTKLLGQLFRDAINYDTISLSVSKGNTAISLYQKSGSEPVREDDTAVVMLKQLSAT